MIAQAGTVLAAIAGRLPISPGRRQRRRWVGNGRAHIEVRGIHRPENHPAARGLEAALAEVDGVQWAQVNTVAGRVVVAFDGDQVGVDEICDVIEGVEDAHDLSDERFPHDRPDHPADSEPIQRQLYAIGADLGGLGLGLAGQLVFGQFGRLARRNPLIGETASLLSLIESTPLLRRPIEGRLGRAATDLSLAVGNAVAQGLAAGPLGLVVDIAQRGLLLDELRARRDLWQQREPMLSGQPASRPAAGPGRRAGGRGAAGAAAGRAGRDVQQQGRRRGAGRRGGNAGGDPRPAPDGGGDRDGEPEARQARPRGLRRPRGPRPGPVRGAGHGHRGAAQAGPGRHRGARHAAADQRPDGRRLGLDPAGPPGRRRRGRPRRPRPPEPARRAAAATRPHDHGSQSAESADSLPRSSARHQPGRRTRHRPVPGLRPFRGRARPRTG